MCAGLCAGLIATAQPAAAQDRETLGYGRIFTNDFFGDGQDRWRSGSYALSIVRGPQWDGVRPAAPGALLEYRLRTEIIAPSTLNGPGSDDRAYVGALSAGLHTHFARGNMNLSGGIDLVAVGDQTGISDLQDSFHNVVDAPSVSNTVDSRQIDNAVYPTVLGEASYRLPVNDRTVLRPFVEAQFGVEDFVRVGADVLIGTTLRGDLWLRDSATGQLYTGAENDGAGTGFILGADFAALNDSAYFPDSFGTTAEETRLRARAGLHVRLGNDTSFFYGLTYLGEEYEGQTQGQVVGSLKLNFNF